MEDLEIYESGDYKQCTFEDSEGNRCTKLIKSDKNLCKEHSRINDTPLKSSKVKKRVSRYLLEDEEELLEITPLENLENLIAFDQVTLHRLYLEKRQIDLEGDLLEIKSIVNAVTTGDTFIKNETLTKASKRDRIDQRIAITEESLRKNIKLLNDLGGILNDTPEEFVNSVRALLKTNEIEITDETINSYKNKYQLKSD